MLDKFKNNKMTNQEEEIYLNDYFSQKEETDKANFIAKWETILSDEDLIVEPESKPYFTIKIHQMITAASVLLMLGFFGLSMFNPSTSKIYTYSSKGEAEKAVLLQQIVENESNNAQIDLKRDFQSVVEVYQKGQLDDIRILDEKTIFNITDFSDDLAYQAGMSAMSDKDFKLAAKYFMKVSNSSPMFEKVVKMLSYFPKGSY